MAIYEKLHAIQGELPTLVKTATNPHFGNEYVPLEEVLDKVLPVLNKVGIFLTQLPDNVGGQPALTTVLHDVNDGTEIRVTAPLVLDRQNSQGVGSAITYMRRYAILSILGLVGEDDDDGNASSKPTPAQEVVRKQRRGAADASDAPVPRF